jgi:acetoin utilization protein AcuB
MIIEQLISPVVPTLLPTDTGNRALNIMEEAHLTQLPLVKENQYIGLVQETDVLDWDTPERALDGADFLDYKPAVFAGGHPFEAMRIASQQNLSIVPVVDNENKYIGSITREDLLKYITENSGMDNPGGILVLQMEQRNYSLSEIARICESEEVLIMSTQVSNNVKTGLLEVTLKTNRTNLEAVVSSFERHEYDVKEVFGAQVGQEELMSRYNLLMNYINM